MRRRGRIAFALGESRMRRTSGISRRSRNAQGVTTGEARDAQRKGRQVDVDDKRIRGDERIVDDKRMDGRRDDDRGGMTRGQGQRQFCLAINIRTRKVYHRLKKI